MGNGESLKSRVSHNGGRCICCTVEIAVVGLDRREETGNAKVLLEWLALLCSLEISQVCDLTFEFG
jgi:hypothetical protein